MADAGRPGRAGRQGPAGGSRPGPPATGRHPADITGVYTAATRQAVRDFQQRHGLPATGAVDEETWRALTMAPPA
ncbi:peptidoglycan-binding domain-containing protein [Streptomyces thermolilacinus]